MPIYMNDALMNTLFDANESLNDADEASTEDRHEARNHLALISAGHFFNFLQDLLETANGNTTDSEDCIDYLRWNITNIQNRVKRLSDLLGPEHARIQILREKLTHIEKFIQSHCAFTQQEIATIQEMVHAYKLLLPRERKPVSVLRALQAHMVAHFALLQKRRHYQGTGTYEATNRDDNVVLDELVVTALTWLHSAGLVGQELELRRVNKLFAEQTLSQKAMCAAQRAGIYDVLERIRLERSAPVLERINRQAALAVEAIKRRLAHLLQDAFNLVRAVGHGLRHPIVTAQKAWGVITTHRAESFEAFLEYARNHPLRTGFYVVGALVIIGACAVGAGAALPLTGIVGTAAEFSLGAAVGAALVAGTVVSASAIAPVDDARTAISEARSEQTVVNNQHAAHIARERERFTQAAAREAARRAAEEFDQMYKETAEANEAQLVLMDRPQLEEQLALIEQQQAKIRNAEAERAREMQAKLEALRRTQLDEAKIREGMLAAMRMLEQTAERHEVIRDAETLIQQADRSEAALDRFVAEGGASPEGLGSPMEAPANGGAGREEPFREAAPFRSAAVFNNATAVAAAPTFNEIIMPHLRNSRDDIRLWLRKSRKDLLFEFDALENLAARKEFLDENLSKKEQNNLLKYLKPALAATL